MGLAKRAAIYVARPIYRTFVEQPLWWFLAKVRTFFMAETSERLLALEQRLAELENQHIHELFRHAEASNAAQWDAIEQLLLAMFRRPEPPTSDSEAAGPSQHPEIPDVSGLSRANGPHTIR
jgi:hypothetical protein